MTRQTVVTVVSEAQDGDIMSQFVSKYAVCPFYHRHDNNRICCEGTDPSNTINIVFEDQKKLKQYESEFCNNINKHSNCLICSMLNKKYEVNYR